MTKGCTIIDLKQTPFIRKDGFQEAVLKLKNNGKKFSGWYKATITNCEPYIMPIGNISKGCNEFKILLTDTNKLLKPSETTVLKLEIYDNKNCTGEPLAVDRNIKLERTKHWKFYLSQTMHTDLGYTDYQEDLRPLFSTFLDTVKEYIKNSDERKSDLEKYKYAVESAWVLGEGYMKRRNAEEIQEIIDLMKQDRMAIGAGRYNYTMECFSTEETARAAYYTNRYLVDKFGISPSTTQRMFDNPAFSKSYVDIASSAGIKYGIHSMNPDRSPYHKKKLYGLFYMEGMNPKNRLLIFNGWTYGDNYGFGGNAGGYGDENSKFSGSSKAVKRNILNLITKLESLTGIKSYPYDKFPMPLIPFGDNKKPLENQIIVANEVNKEWNDAGYIYPRIVSAFPETFFKEIEEEYGGLIPVEHGTEENWWNDGWGTTAFESGINKQSGITVSMAETAAGFSSLLFGGKYPYNDIYNAVERNLTYDEHTWGYHSYTGCEMYNKQFEWKRSNAFGAKALSEKVLENSLKTLASNIKTDNTAIYVYNSLNWKRTDIVSVEDISDFPDNFEILDDGKTVSYCIENSKLKFIANSVPAMGYKTFEIKEVKEKAIFHPKAVSTNNSIENEFYKVIFNNDGTIKSIIDKKNKNREIVDTNAKFNQYQYFDDYGIPFSNMGAKFSKFKWEKYSPDEDDGHLSINVTPISATAVLDTATFRAASIRQKVTLFNGIARIDIVNEVVKSPLPTLRSKEEAFYVFPFAAGEKYSVRYDLPVGNALEGEQVYGTSSDWYTANKWVNIHDKTDNYSMTLAIPNASLLQFGERRTGSWSFDYKSKKAHIYSYIFNNMWQTNFQGDQPGYADFKYSIFTGIGENTGEINRFALNYCTPLKAVIIKNVQKGTDKKSGEYIKISNDNIILTTLKASESNGGGMIMRFSEIAGKETRNVRITLPETVANYNETDIIENDISEKSDGNIITFNIPAYGFKTFRITAAKAIEKVNNARAVSDNGTQISWDEKEGALYYEIFRTRDNSEPKYLASTENTNWYDCQVSTDLASRYKYLVRACTSGEKGEFSDEIVPVAGKIQNIISSDEIILNIIPREKQRLDLYWTPASNAVRYEIYCNGKKTSEISNGYVCTYRDTSVSFGNTYNYTVKAFDILGNFIESNTAKIAHNADILKRSDNKVSKRAKTISKTFEFAKKFKTK